MVLDWFRRLGGPTSRPWTEEEAARFEEDALSHLDELYRTALRMTRRAQEAEDLVQECYTKAFRFADRFEPGTDLRAWLFKILTNSFLNRYRKASREPESTSIDEAGEYFIYEQLGGRCRTCSHPAPKTRPCRNWCTATSNRPSRPCRSSTG